jgi:hypothetical protein
MRGRSARTLVRRPGAESCARCLLIQVPLLILLLLLLLMLLNSAAAAATAAAASRVDCDVGFRLVTTHVTRKTIFEGRRGGNGPKNFIQVRGAAPTFPLPEILPYLHAVGCAAVCTSPCQHNGTCVTPDTCDCTDTGYNGTVCEIPGVWVPVGSTPLGIRPKPAPFNILLPSASSRAIDGRLALLLQRRSIAELFDWLVHVCVCLRLGCSAGNIAQASQAYKQQQHHQTPSPRLSIPQCAQSPV